MASDNKPEITLDGDVSPFRQKLREALTDLKRFGEDGEKSLDKLGGPLEALRDKFVAVGAVLAGGAVFAEAVNMAKEWNEQSVDMAAAMGITATAAGDLKAALAEENVEVSTFMTAAQKLAVNLKNNESGLQGMGLATRDAAGNLRPLNELTIEAIALTGKYKAGTDRAIAASELFGKGFEIAGDLAKINTQLIDENIERQKALGATITEESVAAFEDYDKSAKGVSATLRAVQQTIGTVLMPVLATLGNWFVAVGPAAILVIRGALGGLASAFHLGTTGVTVLWETLNAMVVSVAEPIRALSAAIGKALTGDFEGAAVEIKGIGGTISGAWGQAFDVMTAKAQSTSDRISAIFGQGTATSADGAKGGKSANGLVKPDADKKAADPSYMQYYEAALAEEKRLASEKDALREYTKQQELAFWEQLAKYAELKEKDRLAIEKKVSDLTVAVRRQEAKEKQDVDAEMTSYHEAAALDRIEAEQAAAQAALNIGLMTNQQYIEQEMQFEQRRNAVQRQALEERLQMAEEDPNTSPVARLKMQHQLEEQERKHLMRLRQLQNKSAEESGRIWDDLGSRMKTLWGQGIQAMMNGTFRWRNAFRAIGLEMVNWFATSVVGEMVRKWLVGEATKLAMKMGFLTQEQAAQTVASTAVVATKTAEATSVAGANAVEAGTGAAASQASIPWVGPILAIAAMGAIFAAVSAMSGRMKSASRGYSIPKGVNPVTQLHEEEMVLPSQHAAVIRRLADAGFEGAGGGMALPPISIQAQDSQDVVRSLKRGGALDKALRDLVRRRVVKTTK